MSAPEVLPEKRRRALAVLLRTGGCTAGQFAARYFTGEEHGYLFTAVSNHGNGACAGKKAWLCAGSLLGKLRKAGLVTVVPWSSPQRYVLTEAGKAALLDDKRNKTDKQ